LLVNALRRVAEAAVVALATNAESLVISPGSALTLEASAAIAATPETTVAAVEAEAEAEAVVLLVTAVESLVISRGIAPSLILVAQGVPQEEETRRVSSVVNLDTSLVSALSLRNHVPIKYNLQ